MQSPPREGKTGWLASVILRYPGPVLSTTTKHDVFELTSGVRADLGPVHVFNPQLIGSMPSTFRWNPLEGCQDPATAIRRADAFAQAVSQRGVEDASFWSSKASDYLRAYFFAAAAEEAAGSPDGEYARRYGRAFIWVCPVCLAAVRDRGPFNGPVDDEQGHAEGCGRLAATAAAWESQWDETGGDE